MDAIRNVADRFWSYLPYVVGALAVLVVGWLVSWLVAGLVRRILSRTRIGHRVGDVISPGRSYSVDKWVSRGVFWVLMLFVFVAFFSVLQLADVSQSFRSLLDPVVGYLPRLLGAAVLLAGVWILATVLRAVTTRGLSGLDQRFLRRGVTGPEGEAMSGQSGVPTTAAADAPTTQHRALSRSIGDAVYWLTFLVFLPALLDVLAMGGIVAPVRNMLAKILDFLPNLAIAGLILVVGLFLTRILRRIVTSVLSATGVDRLGEQAGVRRVLVRTSISQLVGWVVYVLVLIPVTIAALDALRLGAITAPAQAMLSQFLAAVPVIFAAALMLVIATVAGRLLGGVTTSILAAAGFDRLIEHVGLGRETVQMRWAPSQIVGWVVHAAVILFAIVSAFTLMGFPTLASVATSVIYLVGRVALGLAVFAAGVFIAGLAARIIRTRDVASADRWAMLARAAILILAGSLGLRAMGFANEIIALAFGLTMGAVAVAAAIAFGLGGRDFAHRKLEEWDLKWHEDKKAPAAREREKQLTRW